MIPQRFRAPYICARCASKQLRRHYSSGENGKAALQPSGSGAARLSNRRLISLRGHDAQKFLQGITTNNVSTDVRNGCYAAFLTAQGKVLQDVFIYNTLGSEWHAQQTGNEGGEELSYLVEVDANQTESLLKHLKRHKLRSKLAIRALEDGELDVWSIWREGDRWTAHGQAQNSIVDSTSIGLVDSRAPGMGHRLLLPANRASYVLNDVEEAPLAAYTVRRYLRGVPEGQTEMPRDDCLPMNSNIDIMGGIDFKKGCYIGQELTIRTHHTGVVRKRILPIMFYDLGRDPPETLGYESSFDINTANIGDPEIRRDDKRQRKTGRVLAGIGNIGLGMCRLEQMSDLVISGEGPTLSPGDRFVLQTSDREVGVRAFVPDWIRGSIRAPKVQKRV